MRISALHPSSQRSAYGCVPHPIPVQVQGPMPRRWGVASFWISSSRRAPSGRTVNFNAVSSSLKESTIEIEPVVALPPVSTDSCWRARHPGTSENRPAQHTESTGRRRRGESPRTLAHLRAPASGQYWTRGSELDALPGGLVGHMAVENDGAPARRGTGISADHPRPRPLHPWTSRRLPSPEPVGLYFPGPCPRPRRASSPTIIVTTATTQSARRQRSSVPHVPPPLPDFLDTSLRVPDSTSGRLAAGGAPQGFGPVRVIVRGMSGVDGAEETLAGYSASFSDLLRLEPVSRICAP